MPDFKQLEKIKKIAIKAIFSDDFLVDRLVLKGGNCIDLAYKLSNRSSIDIDFSMETDFSQDELNEFTDMLQKKFPQYFNEGGYYPFDIKITNRPKLNPKDHKWGGYQLTFKVISHKKYQEFNGGLNQIRKNAIALGKGDSRAFKIDISKFEYCQNKQSFDLDGVMIYIYSPTMTVFEKLRAICQKMAEYEYNPTRKDEPRARDFYDIYIVNEELAKINFKDSENREIITEIFKAKSVPLEFLSKVKEKREVHRDDFISVKATISIASMDYDFYFDYVLALIDELEGFWVI
ncbi:MAG: hypothetical protein ACD_20C00209G0010 [uncultured bacterium]|nr:MAG: hypothetical protein ACD_20C00209G0010 [uncultured bacterium]